MGQDFTPERPRVALIVLALCLGVLLGPSLLVWIIRAVGFAAQCAPGPDTCRGMTLGGGLRDTLTLAWAVGTDKLLMSVLAVVAAVACFASRRPWSGSVILVLMPALPAVLPMLAVWVTRYDGCQINADGIGDCTLWGAHMGSSFHTAAAVPDMIYDFEPYSLALGLMVGVLGWFLFFTRAKAPPQIHATARMRRFEDDGF
jgi:hypothetical protein